MTIRSFIALPIQKEMANLLGDVAAKMSYQDKSNAVRWVDQENYHITLAFLGEQEEADLERLADELDQQIDAHDFTLTLQHVNRFPENKPKLIAAMIAKDTFLDQLHTKVHACIRACGLRHDKRKFIPHITLGRFRHTKNAYAGTLTTVPSTEIWIDELVMYESVLSNHGAEYEAIYRLPLDLAVDY